MNKLPPEEIDGKMYQPVEGVAGTCPSCELTNEECSPDSTKCTPDEREDGLNIYYTNIEGE